MIIHTYLTKTSRSDFYIRSVVFSDLNKEQNIGNRNNMYNANGIIYFIHEQDLGGNYL